MSRCTVATSKISMDLLIPSLGTIKGTLRPTSNVHRTFILSIRVADFQSCGLVTGITDHPLKGTNYTRRCAPVHRPIIFCRIKSGKVRLNVLSQTGKLTKKPFFGASLIDITQTRRICSVLRLIVRGSFSTKRSRSFKLTNYTKN